MAYIWTSKTRREGRTKDGKLRKPHGETMVVQYKDDPDGYRITDERMADKMLSRNHRRECTEPEMIKDGKWQRRST